MNQVDDTKLLTANTVPAMATIQGSAAADTASDAVPNTAADMLYNVVVNDEAQYSIWPTFRDTPAGWHEVGVTGSMASCLAHIETVWTDMRPASLRRFMDQ